MKYEIKSELYPIVPTVDIDLCLFCWISVAKFYSLVLKLCSVFIFKKKYNLCNKLRGQVFMNKAEKDSHLKRLNSN